jgi:hypothetical protein
LNQLAVALQVGARCELVGAEVLRDPAQREVDELAHALRVVPTPKARRRGARFRLVVLVLLAERLAGFDVVACRVVGVVTNGRRDVELGRGARHGWDQGSLLPFRRQLLLTDPANPVSELAAGELAKAKQRDTDGEPVSIVFVRPEQQVGAILVTQVCDLVADPAAEPNCEAMLIIELGAGDCLPQPNSTRAFLLDAEKRWVVDATQPSLVRGEPDPRRGRGTAPVARAAAPVRGVAGPALHTGAMA